MTDAAATLTLLVAAYAAKGAKSVVAPKKIAAMIDVTIRVTIAAADALMKLPKIAKIKPPNGGFYIDFAPAKLYS